MCGLCGEYLAAANETEGEPPRPAMPQLWDGDNA